MTTKFHPSLRLFSALLAFTLTLSSQALAAIGILVEHDSTFGEFDSGISAADLINTDSPFLFAVGSTPGPIVGGLNDGSSALTSFSEIPNPSHFPASVDFYLDTSVNTMGYNLATIVIYSGIDEFTVDPIWFGRHHEFAHQSYSVSVSIVGDPDFVEVTTINQAAATGEVDLSLKVSLSGLAGDVPSGIDAIRFTFNDPVPLLLSHISSPVLLRIGLDVL